MACWCEEDKKALLEFKEAIDSDDIRIKEIIKEKLLDNRFIIHVLNNKELEESDAEPDEYYGTNILPYFIVPDVQTDTKNYLCYEISYNELERYNSSVKLLQLIFHILCHKEDIDDEDTGIARHDLLAALVMDQFNFSNYFGQKVRLVSDRPTTTDSNYPTRTLVFEQITDNNLVKSRNGIPMLANKIPPVKVVMDGEEKA